MTYDIQTETETGQLHSELNCANATIMGWGQATTTEPKGF